MNDWVQTLLNSDYGSTQAGGVSTVVFVMLLSFSIGHFIGFVYMWTHEAISYSRTFVISLAVLPVLIALMMVVMAGSLLIAFGLLAVFGVIRFRNVLKDTRDTAFVIWAMMEGLTIGTMRYSTALVGALGLAVAFLYLRMTSFGTRHRYDAVMTLRILGDSGNPSPVLKRILGRHALRATLMSERRAGDGETDLTYRLLLRNPARSHDLQAALAQAPDVANVSVFLHEDEAEI